MPHLRIETNVPQDNIPADLPAELCKLIAKSLGKPLGYCVATVIGGVNLSWGGTKDPAAQAVLLSLGALGVEENRKHSKAISECISQAIGVPADRMYIHFVDTTGNCIGYNGSTFGYLMNL